MGVVTITGLTRTWAVNGINDLDGGGFRFRLVAWPDEVTDEFPLDHRAQITHSGERFFARVAAVDGNRLDVVQVVPAAVANLDALASAYEKFERCYGVHDGDASESLTVEESAAVMELLRFVVAGETGRPPLK